MDTKKDILSDRRIGMSYGDISKKYGICKSLAYYVVKNHGKQKKKRGPKEKISKTEKRNIQTFLAEKSTLGLECSSRDIIQELGLQVSKSTVCRTLKCLKFDYKSLPSKFVLTTRMRQRRIEAVRRYIKEGIQWSVVFSDEKIFTLHGCKSSNCWIQNNQSPKRVRSILRSPGLMIWGMILPNALLSYTIMKGRQKSEDYISILSDRAMKIIKLNMEQDFTFQQDNCPIHTSKMTMNFLKESKIKVLDWPPYSPDLNIIENVWSILSDLVYGCGPIKNLKELECKIYTSVQIFNETKGQTVENLYNSMPSRLCSLLESHGKRIKY